MREQAFDLKQLNDVWISQDGFHSYDVENLQVLSLLQQSGYVTIKEYDSEYQLYRLAYPNYEVEIGFSKSLFKDPHPHPPEP